MTRKTRYVSRHGRRRYLKGNEVSKSEETRNIKYAYHLWKWTDAAERKFKKYCWEYSLPNLARFWHIV